MAKGFQAILRRYCTESTLVGLKYLYLYPGIVSRCFWVLNMLGMWIISCSVTWLLYCRFAEMPTRITIESQFEPVYDLPYPTITLCSPNQMTISAMNHFNRTLIDGNVTINLERALPLLLGFYEQIENVDEDELNQLQHVLEANRYNIIEVMRRMPQNCDRFLKRCALGKKIRDCKQLFKPILTTHGYCCAFNSKYYFNDKDIIVNRELSIHKVKNVGLPSSLVVVTDYEVDDAITATLLNAGSVRVMLTDWTEYPVDYETYLVDTNGESFLFLQAVYTYCSDEVRSLPPWSRNCYFENEHKVFGFKDYHNSDCDHMCYVQAVLNTCKCWLFILPWLSLKAEKICKANHIPCIMDVKKNMSSWLTTELCICPRDCVSRQYKADINTGNFRALPYLINSQHAYQGLVYNSSSSVMNFLFQSPVYVKLKQETVISIISLVSNLGGVFGLFMGCSTVSVLEIVFYIYKAVKSYIVSRREQRRKNVIDYYR